MTEDKGTIWEYDCGKIILARYPALLVPLRVSIREAAEDFAKRCRIASVSPEWVARCLFDATRTEGAFAFLALDNCWKLLGFTVLTLVRPLLGGSDIPEAAVWVSYMRPDKPTAALERKISEVITEVAKEHGVTRIRMMTARNKPKAWGRLGYEPVGVVYERKIDGAVS